MLAVIFGRELFEAFGHRLESVSGLLLIGFGTAYGVWGLHRTIRAGMHGHAHATGHPHVHTHLPHGRIDAIHRPLTAWSLFVLFSADPCVAVIPLMFVSVPLGWLSTLAVVAAYEAATIGTMVMLVLPARAAVRTIRGAWADRWGDALAGGFVALVGLVVTGLGI